MKICTLAHSTSTICCIKFPCHQTCHLQPSWGAHRGGAIVKRRKTVRLRFLLYPTPPSYLPFFFLNMQFKSLTPPLAALGLETVRVISSGCKLRPALALREKTTQEGRILDPERPHTKHGQQSILFRFFVYLWCP